MKKTKFLAILAAGAMVLGGGLASCTPSDDPNPNPNPNPNPDPEGKTIDLVLSGPGDEAEVDMDLIEDFKEYRKSIGDPNTYNVERVSHGADKIDSEVTDWTTGPDVYAYASDKTQELFKKGALGVLRGDYETFVLENNSQTGIDAATFNEDLYGFPYTGDNTYYLMYDKSVFTEEDVQSVEGILAKCAETGTTFAYKLQEGFYGQGAMFTFGADYNLTFTEDGQISTIEADFNGEAGVKAAKAIYSIATDSNWIDEYIVAGTDNTKIAVNGTWSINDAKALLGDNYGCAPMPTVTVDGDTKPLGNFIGAKLFGVNPQRSGTDQDRLTAAYNLAMYLSDADAQEKRFDLRETAPSNLTVAALDKVTSNTNVQTLVKQNEWGHAQTVVPGEAWNAPGVLLGGIKDGTVTLDNIEEACEVYNNSIINSK